VVIKIAKPPRRLTQFQDCSGDDGVALRTLYRDIAALLALGAEIEGEAGVGYVLRPGFLLPPLMFSEEEIEALALGAKWAARRTDDALSDAARNAVAKLSAFLPEDLRAKLNDEALLVGPGWERPQHVDLKLLRRALRDERKLAISYRDEKGARTERVIWLVAIGFFESTRVLAGWCELRAAFRHFRADRIEGTLRLWLARRCGRYPCKGRGGSPLYCGGEFHSRRHLRRVDDRI
jgi:predicted DNA-binding transcriptional regulator YafY